MLPGKKSEFCVCSYLTTRNQLTNLIQKVQLSCQMAQLKRTEALSVQRSQKSGH